MALADTSLLCPESKKLYDTFFDCVCKDCEPSCTAACTTKTITQDCKNCVVQKCIAMINACHADM